MPEIPQVLLFRAAQNGYNALVPSLLKSGRVDVNKVDGIFKQTPFFAAARLGHQTTVRTLLESPNVEIDARDVFETTALIAAAWFGYEIVVQLLFDRRRLCSKKRRRIDRYR